MNVSKKVSVNIKSISPAAQLIFMLFNNLENLFIGAEEFEDVRRKT